MKKTLIMDENAINRAVARMTHEIIERNQGVEEICLLGVKSRGIPLAERIKENVLKFEKKEVPIGHLDITLHRDDLSNEEKVNKATACHIPCDLRDKTVIIVDDVLYTGCTARAAIESVFAVSRPKAVQLAVLIARGPRELPIRPDFIGKNVPTSKHEEISVLLNEKDGANEVYILSLND